MKAKMSSAYWIMALIFLVFQGVKALTDVMASMDVMVLTEWTEHLLTSIIRNGLPHQNGQVNQAIGISLWRPLI
ncbi:hypothetical protein JCM15548_13209 [Geofilum rubicundum JCM 15548]|uniref:Uncharacterized protein n=1 Tax=Geofilum rubicundum JCM 15548 TaxID=1236989 RepID=A0A0E9M0K3_9BACT|nr:hypothetical protein JCM15548_13209 [Geofilum rubicundum JCM 15548]